MNEEPRSDVATEPRATMPPPLLLASTGIVALAILAVPLLYCSHMATLRDAHEQRVARRAERARLRHEAAAARHGGSAASAVEPGSTPAAPVANAGSAPAAPAAAGGSDRYTVVAVTNGGQLGGHVRWSGDRPPMDAIPVTRNPEVCGQSVPFPALAIGAGDGVGSTVVYLEGIRQGKAFPTEPPMIDQQACSYHPHVLAAGLDQDVVFRNSDGVLHNIHGFWSDSDWFNTAQPIRGMTSRKRADHEGVARIVCDVHGWMLAYVRVLPHPYVAVTGDDGSYTIGDIPPGTYQVHAWHEGWRVTGTAAGRPIMSPAVELSGSATVAAGATATLDFTLSSASGG